MAEGPVQIRNGYGKSPEHFRKNARIREVEVILIGQGFTPFVQGTMFADTPVLGRHVVELADTAAWQALPLPSWTFTPPAELPGPKGSYSLDQRPTFIALEIRSVWPGETWEDTCVSEVRLTP